MTAPGPDDPAQALGKIEALVEDLAHAVDAARRLVRCGHGVDLAPLDDDVRVLTDMIAAVDPAKGGETARRLAQSLRALSEGLDRLEADLASVEGARAGRG